MRPFLLLLVLAVAAPAYAQRFPSRNTNDRLIEQAVTDLGGDVRQRGMTEAIQRAFAELYPDAGTSSRFRLSETQARAIAYIALEYAPRPYPGQGNGWPGNGNGGWPGQGNQYGQCRNVNERLYDLSIAIPEDRFSLFLDDDEIARLRTDLTAIGRDAASCGCRSVSDSALALLRQVNGDSMPRRANVIQSLDNLRRQAESCR